MKLTYRFTSYWANPFSLTIQRKRDAEKSASRSLYIKEEDYLSPPSQAWLIAVATSTNSSFVSFSFGLENIISDSF